MKSPSSKAVVNLSLDQQIEEIEQRLALHQKLASVHASALNEKVRANLSSPVTLFIAAGVGFCWSYFAREAKAKPAESVAETSTENTDGKSDKKSFDWFGNLMQIITLVEAVKMLIPAKTEVPHSEETKEMEETKGATEDSPEVEMEFEN